MRRVRFWAAIVFLASARVHAQVPAGGEFRVNAYTLHHQASPSIAVERDGDFILVWSSDQDGDRAGVFAQRYDATGARRGGEFQVNTYTTGVQSSFLGNDVSVDRNGNFVVVWSSDPEPGGDQRGIFGQRYDSLGNAVGGEFHVNTFTLYQQSQVVHGPRVAVAAAGNFVVVWDSGAQDGDNYGVFARRYDATGNPLGGEFQVNTVTTGRQLGSNIDMDAAGNFVVVWAGDSLVGFEVFGQRFDAGGNRIGGEFQVNTFTTGYQGSFGVGDPKVAVAEDGAFAVLWDNFGVFPLTIVGQRYDRSGSRVGGEFVVDANNGPGAGASAIGADTDTRGNLVVTWTNEENGFPQRDIAARRSSASGAPRGGEFRVNTYTTDRQSVSSVASDDVGNFVIAWHSYRQDGSAYGVFAQRFGGLRPQALTADAGGNRVLEPGETGVVQPTWRNINGALLTFGGTLTDLTGPTGPTYTITDGTAGYGTVANAGNGICTDCYGVLVAGPRPAMHWDASAVETITPDTLGQQKQWALHVGGSFADVSTTSPFYRFIETLLHYGVSTGCSGTQYCPAAATTREQMAVFVLVTKEGTGYLPVGCTAPVFADVPASSPFCRWIEELARRGVVTGCGGGNYCPGDPVSREQMAVFVLVTLDPTLNPPACTTPMFNDVPASSSFCRWIEELARRSVVTGCGGGNYCPGSAVTREQMGVFLSATFGLTLYGP